MTVGKSDPNFWITKASEDIVARWEKWSNEAEEISTLEQDSSAGESHMVTAVERCIRAYAEQYYDDASRKTR